MDDGPSAGRAPETEAERLEREGRALLAAGKPAEAIPPLKAAIRLDAGRGFAWHDLAVAFALVGEIGPLLALVDGSGRLFESRIVFFHSVVIDLMARHARDVVMRLHGRIPPERPYHAVALYYAGCVEAARDRWPQAFSFFGRFRAIVVPNRARYPVVEDENFNLIFRQGTLIEPPRMMAAIAAAGPDSIPPFEPTLEPVGAWRPAEAPFVVLSVCDSAYFAEFAPTFVRSLHRRHPTLPLHLHVIAADAGTTARLDGLRAEMPGLVLNASLEREPPFRNAVYYACNRLLIAPRLLDHYRRSLLTLDVDGEVVGDLQVLVGATQDADFACFDTGRTDPASRYLAAIMLFADNPRARRFLDVAGRLVRLKLPQPPAVTWMLDQAALVSAIRYMELAEKDFRFRALGALAGLAGRDATQFVRALGTMESKRELMNRPPLGNGGAED